MHTYNNNYCFSLKGDILYSIKESQTRDYEIANKGSVSLFLANMYNDIRYLLNSFYSEFETIENIEQHYNDKAVDYIKKYGQYTGYLYSFANQDTTILELRAVFDILIDYSEDNILLCMPSFIKKNSGYTFKSFIKEYSPNYEQSFAFLDNQTLNIISTTGFISFIGYLCYTADETVRRFKICPTCLDAIIEGNASRYFCNDAHKSRYNWLVVKDPILKEYKMRCTEFRNAKLTYISDEDIQRKRTSICNDINWNELKKYKYDIFDSALITK